MVLDTELDLDLQLKNVKNKITQYYVLVNFQMFHLKQPQLLFTNHL